MLWLAGGAQVSCSIRAACPDCPAGAAAVFQARRGAKAGGRAAAVGTRSGKPCLSSRIQTPAVSHTTAPDPQQKKGQKKGQCVFDGQLGKLCVARGIPGCALEFMKGAVMRWHVWVVLVDRRRTGLCLVGAAIAPAACRPEQTLSPGRAGTAELLRGAGAIP